MGGIQNPSLPHGVCYSDAHRSSRWVLYRCHSATEGEWREISVVEPAITIANIGMLQLFSDFPDSRTDAGDRYAASHCTVQIFIYKNIYSISLMVLNSLLHSPIYVTLASLRQCNYIRNV